MKLKNFTAPNINAAMEKIRRELGENAIIISTTKESNGSVRVTAAIDNAEADFEEIQYKLAAKPKFQGQLGEVFKFHKIPASITDLLVHLGDDYKSTRDALEDLLDKAFKFEPIDFTLTKPLMIIGMPGIGKTLAVSKIATEASLNDMEIRVITTDIKRAGGIEQLSAFTKLLGIELQIARNPNELKEELEKTKGSFTIIDTAGANPYDQFELDSIKALLSVAAIEPILAIQAGGDVEEAADMAAAFQFANSERVLITKADSARRLGSVFAAVQTNALAFSNFSGTPNVGEGLEIVTPKSLAKLILKPIE